MRSLSNTITRLEGLRARSGLSATDAASSALSELTGFGSNPGRLKAWISVPDAPAAGLPLVVVLHGCTQNAAGYDRGAGWSQLGRDHGFAVLLPEQDRSNNPNLCFNWYDLAHSRRGAGEPLSISQMIDAMIERHGVDRDRVFVTGLSAGGAMASVMLATYPETFAGGAVIAGLPFGSARSIPEAFDRMRGHGGPDTPQLAAAVRAASKHSGPWPRVAVWHGMADHIVAASNGDAIVAQWRDVHGVARIPAESGTIDGYPHRAWRNADGRIVVEEYRITGMGHGTPLATTGDDGCGASGAHMLEVGISSTRHIAASWGLMAAPRGKARPRVAKRGSAADRAPHKPPAATGVQKVIEDALRTAGLM